MKLFKIEVHNFRLLKEFCLDIEDTLSLIIGKNNTGKTSILSVLNKFINYTEKNKFTFDDFNLDFKKELITFLESNDIIEEDDFQVKGLKLRLFIEYFDEDDLSNISDIMMDLDPDNHTIAISFEYALHYDDYIQLKKEFKKFSVLEKAKKAKKKDYKEKNLNGFLKNRHLDYFKISKKALEYNPSSGLTNEENTIDLIKEKIPLNNIINFKFISAKRDVTNKDIDKTLSGQTSKIYKRTEASEDQNNAVEDFKDRLSETDDHLSGIYQTLFKDIIGKVKTFGGFKFNESQIEIISALKHRELLEGNTTVVYKHDANNHLPEHYNGLGYMNLISMIFEIEILIHEFKKTKDKKPADINLLFIEEPEAHTHPQMQYVFIKNIKQLLSEGIVREDKENRKLQYIISTHSAHIVSDSDFNDIKYLKKESSNSIQAKNLKDLEKEYKTDGEKQNFRFLKQYLTLNRAELFFADKAIFIEGDTEKILLPAMMKKIDQEFCDSDNPLLSQNISIIEVGAHSQIFEKLINFIGITKSLIITDIDSYYLEPVIKTDGKTQETHKNGSLKSKFIKCSTSDPKAQNTSNNSLKFFYQNNEKLSYYKKLDFTDKVLIKDKEKQWVSDKKGNLLVIFQTKEESFHARSFEDAFFHINKKFIVNSKNLFPAITLKHLNDYKNNEIDAFQFSEKGVRSKPSLAIEVLLNSKADNSNKEFSNWNIPAYIKEGLIWLMKD